MFGHDGHTRNSPSSTMSEIPCMISMGQPSIAFFVLLGSSWILTAILAISMFSEPTLSGKLSDYTVFGSSAFSSRLMPSPQSPQNQPTDSHSATANGTSIDSVSMVSSNVTNSSMAFRLSPTCCKPVVAAAHDLMDGFYDLKGEWVPFSKALRSVRMDVAPAEPFSVLVFGDSFDRKVIEQICPTFPSSKQTYVAAQRDKIMICSSAWGSITW